MKWLILVAAFLVGVVALELHALPATPSGPMPTRQVPVGGVYKQPEVNEVCRELCEPHCQNRWGNSSLSSPMRRACFFLCIDRVCYAP